MHLCSAYGADTFFVFNFLHFILICCKQFFHAKSAYIQSVITNSVLDIQKSMQGARISAEAWYMILNSYVEEENHLFSYMLLGRKQCGTSPLLR
jgi:hypothetical protein